MNVSVVCHSCGHNIPVVGSHAAALTCANCGAINSKPDDGAITATAPDPSADNDDGRPYDIDGDDFPSKDDADVPSIANEDEIQPIHLEWDGSPPLQTRLKVFIAYAAGLLPISGFLIATDNWSLLDAVIAVPIVTALAAFVLGTYDRVVLTRNFRGRVTLSKSWRICFFELKPRKIKRKDYLTVATTSTTDHELTDWLVLIWLLGSGLLPGILWFFMVHIKPVHQVALTNDHGRAAFILYQGRNEDHAREIARAVSEYCKYRWQQTY